MVKALIGQLIVLDPLLKVLHSVLRAHALVVWTHQLDLQRPEVEVWGLRLGFLRCEVQVGVLRFEVEVWGLGLGLGT